MAGNRRTFRREGETQRRDDLIAAALDCIAAGGPMAATVRNIAERAGVTPGLIRHYFSTKEELIGAAYARLMAGMTAESEAVLTGAGSSPLDRLTAFVRASVTPPVVDPRAMALWAGFIHMVQRDAAMRAVHHQSYLGFRDQLEVLIAGAMAEAGRVTDALTLRRLAIACNAVIDGLWLEGSALPDAFEPDELAHIALRSIGALLELTLGPAANQEENG